MKLTTIGALAAAAALALPAAAQASDPTQCVTGGQTGDPVQDCYAATGIGNISGLEGFVSEWSAPTRVAVVLPTVPPAVCQLFSHENTGRPADVIGSAGMFCNTNSPVPSNLSVTILHENGLLTTSTQYLYNYNTTTCVGQQSCFAPDIEIGGTYGSVYRDAARFEIRLPGVIVGVTPWCVRTQPDTLTCWATETYPAVGAALPAQRRSRTTQAPSPATRTRTRPSMGSLRVPRSAPDASTGRAAKRAPSVT